MLAGAAAVMRQFPFSETVKGVSYVSVQPVSWSETSVYGNRFVPPATPEDATASVAEFAAEDFAITFEAWWDLWAPSEEGDAGDWILTQIRVNFLLQGRQFDDGIYAEQGHIQIDFGLDYPFVQEGELDDLTAKKVQANIATLAEFSRRIELSCSLAGRTLWSDSESNLAQKMIARLQGTH